MWKKVLIMLFSVSLLGACTGMRTVNLEKMQLDEAVQPGQRVLIVDRHGGSYDVTVGAVDNREITGVLNAPPGTRITIKAEDIVRLETWGVDGVKTVMAAAGTAAGVYAFFYWLAKGLQSIPAR